MKALFKYKISKIFKLKRTYILLSLIALSFLLSFLIKDNLKEYNYLCFSLFTLLTVILTSNILSLYLTEDKDNTLMTFLKIDKKKHKLYVYLIFMISFMFISLYSFLLALLLNVYKNSLNNVLLSILIGVISVCLAIMFEKIQKGE